jgi:hypothetical protein
MIEKFKKGSEYFIAFKIKTKFFSLFWYVRGNLLLEI